MAGRNPVNFLKIKSHVKHGDLKSDWVVGGVIVNQSAPKISQKGSKYVIWTLSDLKAGLKTVGVFLFGKTYDKLWKTNPGTVIGILNPGVLSQNDKSKDEATLSIINPDQVMIWGRSKDLGYCKAKKKNGDKCSSFVNLNECEFCQYHVQSEYKKFNSSRGELQSPSFGPNRLRNKVLGKSEVFYGGKSFTAIPGVGSKKIKAKDEKRLTRLGGSVPVPQVKTQDYVAPVKNRGANLLDMLKCKPGEKEAQKDCARLKSLFGGTSYKKVTDSPSPKPNINGCPVLSDPGNKHNGLKSLISGKTAAQVSTSPILKTKPTPTISNPEIDLSVDFKNSSNPKDAQKIDLSVDFKRSQKQSTTLKVAQKNASNKSKSLLQSTFNSIFSDVADKIKSAPQKSTEIQSIKESSLNGSKSDSQSSNSSPVLQKQISFSSPMNPFNTPKNTSKPSPRTSQAKKKALQYVKAKGKISKDKPTGITKEEMVAKNLKRPLETDESEEPPKKQVFSEKYIEIMNKSTKHKDLVDVYDQKEEDAYYAKMEKKEQLEEKMLATYKLECKAVKCLKCNYTWFSASDSCKEQQHPLRVVDAMKRFFKCAQCENRTVSLDIIPLTACKKCGSSNWMKTSMMKEKVITKSHELSIRGGEQTFVNSVIQNGNLDLLVPEQQ